MPVPKTGPLRNIGDYFPAVCTESPVHNSGFCGEHTDLIQSLGLPTKVQSFITYCGADPKNFTTKEKAKVKQVLRTIVENQDSQIHVPTSEEDQGIEFLLENEDISRLETQAQQTSSPKKKSVGVTKTLESLRGCTIGQEAYSRLLPDQAILKPGHQYTSMSHHTRAPF